MRDLINQKIAVFESRFESQTCYLTKITYNNLHYNVFRNIFRYFSNIANNIVNDLLEFVNV